MARLARPARISAAALTGLITAAESVAPMPLAALALLALALTGRRPLLAALAVGLVAGWARPDPPPPRPGEPVTLVGRSGGPWRRAEGGWLGSMRTDRYRQGLRVELWRERVALFVPGETRPPSSRELRLRGLVTRPAGLANRPQLPPGRWRAASP